MYATVMPPLSIMLATRRNGAFEPRVDISSSSPTDMNIRKIPPRKVTYAAVGIRSQNSRRRDKIVHGRIALEYSDYFVLACRAQFVGDALRSSREREIGPCRAMRNGG